MVAPATPLRAGVIGLRRGIGFVRLLSALDGVTLAAVADRDGALVERVCREHNVPRGCSSLDELLDVGLDVLVVATPPALHVPHAIQALEHGVHVLSEVPAIAKQEECEALIAAVERSGRHYMLAENCCYWAFVDATRQLFERGAFGTLFYGEAEYIHDIPSLRRDASGAPTWRATLEPIIYCTHSLGPLMWIGGRYPVEASCVSTGSHFDAQTPDLQTALFKLDDGNLLRVTCSFANAHWTGHRLTVFGTRASLDTGWIGRDQPRFWTADVPHLQGPVALPLGTDIPNAPAAARLGGHGTVEWRMVQAFLQSIRDDTPPPIDVYDGIMYSLPGIIASDAARQGRPLAIPQYQDRRGAS